MKKNLTLSLFATILVLTLAVPTEKLKLLAEISGSSATNEFACESAQVETDLKY